MSSSPRLSYTLYTSVSVCNVTHFNTVKQAKNKMLLLSSNLSSLSPPFFSSRVYAFVVNNFRGHIPLKEAYPALNEKVTKRKNSHNNKQKNNKQTHFSTCSKWRHAKNNITSRAKRITMIDNIVARRILI